VNHVVKVPFQISDGFGLDWAGQLQRMKRDPVVLSEGNGRNTHTLGRRGAANRDTAIALLNGWLFGIEAALLNNPRGLRHMLFTQSIIFNGSAERRQQQPWRPVR
jgi:hypothetical protein